MEMAHVCLDINLVVVEAGQCLEAEGKYQAKL